MSEKKSRSSDICPKCGIRSWSADGYVWSCKKRSRSSRNDPGLRGPEGVGPIEEQGARSTSCPRRRRERKCSCTVMGEVDIDVPCRKALSRRSLRQKFQDAVGQCFPLRTDHRHHHHGCPTGAYQGAFSVLLWSKRPIHVTELMQDKCPFSSKSELAHCWHLIKKHATHPSAIVGLEVAQAAKAAQAAGKEPVLSTSTSPPSTPLSWEGICLSRPLSLEDWDLSHPHGRAAYGGSHTDYILVPDLLQINNSPCYWGVLDRFQAEELLEGQPEGTFLLRDSAQDKFLFSVSFRRYSRSLHARIEQNGKRFSFDGRDPCMYRDPSVTGLLRHYSDPATCLFFEPLLSRPLARTFPFTLQHLCRAVICSCTTYQGIKILPLPHQLRDYLRQYHYKCNGACAV
ncbi:suppressor of cytokine signaling 4 [Oncorhynchus kisutch]|uniref:Suppressor of cytokine signaling 4 n=1 Tax=Oncorhynchus kisutch TaxID=8019 RepID=A0A8C7FEU3_ONCKI|nr:suppressor of cytokine signaling 4 [Oncorhynchus kisutch]